MASPLPATGTSMDPPTSTTTTTVSDTAASVEEPPSSAEEPPASSTPSGSEVETPATTRSLMGPPQPENPSIPNTEPPQCLSAKESEHDSSEEQPPLPPPQDSIRSKQRHSQNVEVPYTIPQWSEAPSYPFQLEVLKDGSIIDQLDVTKKGAYMFGRIDICDFVLEHPTISRFHAVLQFKGNEDAFLYDLGSTHGSFINKNQVKKKVYVKLHVGDVIRFGLSSRLYIFQGPTELMPPEADLTNVNYAKDREASLRRAREDVALADGISWGMREDAIEEAEDDSDEITWQNYKGELTEKQQKTREKVLKRMEKIAHMKKEISAIRAKDIAQGGLTQGQQTQIARNELRISEIFEELESLEETLNDSIRESIGARTGRSSLGRQKGPVDEEDEFLSDDDEFYDRTIKKSANKAADTQSIETADSLLDKQEALEKKMEGKRGLLMEEKNKMSESGERDAGDALDAFMSGLSSQLVLDRTVQLEKDLSSLQTELDRVVYLLKIADPTGEAAKKRQTTSQELKSNESGSSRSSVKRPEESKMKSKKVRPAEKPITISSAITEQVAPDVADEATEAQKPDVDVTDPTEKKPTVYQAVKPQWLGAVEEDRGRKDSQQEKQFDTDEGGDEFVDYKDRKKILDSDLENAAPGLILRKKKQVEKTEASEEKPSNSSRPGPAGADMMAEDAVALLLKHKRGLHASDEDAAILGGDDGGEQKQSGQDNKRPKRVLGPEKPAFLENRSDYETWVPPEGQSGDGRTSLNDRLGY